MNVNHKVNLFLKTLNTFILLTVKILEEDELL